MEHTLIFHTLHEYDSGQFGITVPVFLRRGDLKVSLDASLDTGSTFCIFQRIYGEGLDLDIEGGWKEQVGTAMGSFTVYGHEVTIDVLDYEFTAFVYFAAEEAFTRNVLGRRGWIEQFSIGLIDYEGKLFLRRYGSE